MGIKKLIRRVFDRRNVVIERDHLTTDPTDPRLGHGVDSAPRPQQDAYLVLPEKERARGFVRPVVRTYMHKSGPHPCGVATTMSLALAETYAREPAFYGATYCVGCKMHLPVAEFVWDYPGTGAVGS